MGLLLPVDGPQLDHRAAAWRPARAAPARGPPGPGGTSACAAKTRSPSAVVRRTGASGGRNGSRASPKAEPRPVRRRLGAELVDLAVAVQQHAGRSRDRARTARRVAGTLMPGSPVTSSGRRAAGEDPRVAQRRHDRAGAGEQHDVGPLGADPAQQRGPVQHLDRSRGRRRDLRGRGADRVVDHHLGRAPVRRHRVEGRRAPLEVGVGVGDGEHADGSGGRAHRAITRVTVGTAGVRTAAPT